MDPGTGCDADVCIANAAICIAGRYSGCNYLLCQLAVTGRCDSDCLAEQSSGVAAAVPANLTHCGFDRQVGFPKQSGKLLGAHGHQVRHW